MASAPSSSGSQPRGTLLVVIHYPLQANRTHGVAPALPPHLAEWVLRAAFMHRRSSLQESPAALLTSTPTVLDTDSSSSAAASSSSSSPSGCSFASVTSSDPPLSNADVSSSTNHDLLQSLAPCTVVPFFRVRCLQ
eukprot:TRINITY_DN5954_c1_g1_i2.p1 TRINITY_DN5954_c1_g1~~TRINITY_DN5954_c1_g1_i2.p1  ORF type:complete len:136 (-),score=14.87 TRINITY_DN5954_c1_g1_i2:137-544(-)